MAVSQASDAGPADSARIDGIATAPNG